MRKKIIHTLQLVVLAALLAMPSCASARQQYAEHSLLATGQWYKIPVATAGLYKVTTAEIPSLNGAQCADIALYGHAGGM